MKKNYFPILLFTLLLSCKTKESKKPIGVIIYDTLTIPLDNRVSSKPQTVQYLETDSGEYLAISNKFLPSIEIYNLQNSKKVKSIYVPEDGPNRVSLFNGFQIVSPDSILLASIPPKIVRFNIEGEKQDEVVVIDADHKVNYLGSTNEYPFIVEKGVIFGAQPFFNNIHHVRPSEISDYRHIYKITYKNGTPITEWLPISHPADVWKKGKISANFTWTDRYDSIIVSPVSDHRLWIISKSRGKVIDYKKSNAQLITKFQYLDKIPEGDKGIIEAIETGQYHMIKYDPYRDVFYRFFYLGVDWEEMGFGYRDLFSNRPRIGVLVLDGHLNILGEHIFEDHHIQTWNFFVGRNGLYVSTNNPLKDNFDENFLKYEIIRFDGLIYAKD